MKRLHRITSIAAILGLLLGASPALAQDPAPPLFELGSEVFGDTSASAVGEYEITPDLARLRSAAPALTLELPGVGSRRARLVELQSRGRGDLTWTGRLDPEAGDGAEEPGRNVVLTLEGGVLSGIVFTEERIFQIAPRSQRRHRLEWIDPDLLPDCAGGAAPRGFEALLSRAGEPPARLAPKASVVIDVMVVYTPAALSAAGGVDEIKAVIQSAVDVTNVAFDNSEVDLLLSLAHTEEIAYTETGNIALDLNWVATDPAVAALREAHHADVVSLIISGGSTCGIAFVQADPDPSFESAAFQVTRLDCASADLTFAHEVAHLLGAEHNPEDSVRWPSGASFPWSFGHFHHGAYRTVMSISASCAVPCPRLPYFSNPNVVLSGLPTGVADVRENFRTIQLTRSIVSGFRTRPPVIFTDGFETGSADAWSTACSGAGCEL